MIKYLEIVNIIKDINEDIFDEFNEKVSLPLALSNCDSIFKELNGNIIIQRESFEFELNLETRQAFTEIIAILKVIENDLYNKIDYQYIDFFEKFKDVNYKFEVKDNLNNTNLKELTLKILVMFNLKFWCKDDLERKEFLELFRSNDISDSEEDVYEVTTSLENTDTEENLQIIKNNWWLKLLNKIRNLGKK